MNGSHPAWKRLVRLAAAPDAKPEMAPTGFATRVAARAFETSAVFGVPLERYVWRALGVATLVMIVTVALNVRPVIRGIEEEALSLVDAVVAGETNL
jgi:hypothetical protein